MGRRAPRKIGIEGLNDHGLALTSLALGLLGACYGFATSTSSGAIFFTALYGFAGVTIGVPIGFVTTRGPQSAYPFPKPER
jgi:hypothetical protein